MRTLALIVAASLVAGCGTTSYKIPGSELRRLAQLPPETRGQSVRVIQELDDADLGDPTPVTAQTDIVLVPRVVVGGNRYPRRDHRGWGPNANLGGTGTSTHSHGGGWGHHGGGGGGSGGGGGDARALVVVVIVIAAIALVAAATVEGARYDGYAQLHPMHPIYLFGRDGSQASMPLAWLDPESAAFADHAIVRSNEGPWRELGRAPLDRVGFTYAMLGGLGTFQSADGSKATGTATSIQLGVFPEQHIGLVGSVFFGWRPNAVAETLFEARYTAELQGYPIQMGRLHLGLYAGAGAATRLEDGIPGGNSTSRALIGGALFQLDINTRIALTARLGLAHAHEEPMADALIGLSIY